MGNSYFYGRESTSGEMDEVRELEFLFATGIVWNGRLEENYWTEVHPKDRYIHLSRRTAFFIRPGGPVFCR